MLRILKGCQGEAAMRPSQDSALLQELGVTNKTLNRVLRAEEGKSLLMIARPMCCCIGDWKRPIGCVTYGTCQSVLRLASLQDAVFS
jgi:hypothetical protein